MMENCCCFKTDKEHEQHDRTDTEEHHGQCEKPGGQDHFAEVKSGGRAHIHVEVGMMDVMKTPEERDHVHGPVPPPVCVIHQQKRGDNRCPMGKVQPVKQSDLLISCPNCDRERNRQRRQTNYSEAGKGKEKITYQPMDHAEVLAS